jgi:hypothetical protein
LMQGIERPYPALYDGPLSPCETTPTTMNNPSPGAPTGIARPDADCGLVGNFAVQRAGSAVNGGARLLLFATILRGKWQIESSGKVGRNETP